VTVTEVKSRIEAIIHGYEWANDNLGPDTLKTASILIEQLNELLADMEKESQ